ncbi:phosphoribosylanthranilate isomerase [Flavilitoribacter nigricans]|uniref:N-(5'-phosphoribosyl)anthranilate isomerase n=1 Tax=Flavilitoribacter nigricans (strain ATCC 23147 / DSM 23189 / NBRC 102662 / NCIMB 1420 / SS-2) TaxID=1122177 RepID=A0A2D0NJ91_FLAN2|nr:phosphoribosylanthranilate isomerase [Flavilitoribacter nigricans]PHN08508.1 phosphoribosylanthranilate isomerase [Flavilitoribacter nigricans DSM 23189 = NBRC 102662]
MKIKVCGMREPENILAIAQLPIDFIGFILYPNSPRFVGKKGLPQWLEKNDEELEGIARVGVFVNAEVDQILNAVHDFRLDYVQLHGDESPEYCRELQTYWTISSMRSAQIIKAFRVDESFNFTKTQAYERLCAYFLFDTKAKEYGGTGQRFDWSILEKYMGMTPYLLSGGIDLSMVDEIRKLNFKQLEGVDINSRFELEPGKKDVDKVEQFVKALKG